MFSLKFTPSNVLDCPASCSHINYMRFKSFLKNGEILVSEHLMLETPNSDD